MVYNVLSVQVRSGALPTEENIRFRKRDTDLR